MCSEIGTSRSKPLTATTWSDPTGERVLVSAGHGLSLLPRYTAWKNQGRGFVLRPLAGVKASRSIVALAPRTNSYSGGLGSVANTSVLALGDKGEDTAKTGFDWFAGNIYDAWVASP